MARTLVSIHALLLLGLALSPAAADAPRPQRIVSMNQCTDQFLLLLVEPERIASISFVSQQPQWTPPEYAGVVAGLTPNHGLAEEVLMLKPDLIVTGVFSNRQSVALLRKLGHAVEDFEPEAGFEDIRRNVLRMGDLVGEPERARDVVEAFDVRLADIRRRSEGSQLVLADVGVGGFMAGDGTLTAEAANAAGHRLLGQELGFAGFRYVPLEQIIAGRPDVVAPSNAWTEPPSISTNALRHPAFRRLSETSAFIDIPERLLVCGSPAVLDAAERLTAARPGPAPR